MRELTSPQKERARVAADAGRARAGGQEHAADTYAHPFLQMQSALGNQAVLRLLRARGEGGGVEAREGAALSLAGAGVAGAAGSLPHIEAIQRSFGRHDLSRVEAHTGPEASAASRELGAHGYALGNHVAFDGAPDLHTAAHEAAHVVQQRGAGFRLQGSVGRPGDAYERHADAVADAAARGLSAESLLDLYAPPDASQRASGAGSRLAEGQGRGAVQMKARQAEDDDSDPEKISKQLIKKKVVVALNDADVEYLLGQDFGINILNDLGLNYPSKEEKLSVLKAGSLAFTLGMLKHRNDYMDEEYRRRHGGEGPAPGAEKSTKVTKTEEDWKALNSKDPEVRRAKNQQLIDMIALNPDMALVDKQRQMELLANRYRDSFGLGTPDPALGLNIPDLYSHEFQAQVVTSLKDAAEPFFRKMIELGWVATGGVPGGEVPMPDQLLAAVGDATKTSGIAGTKKIKDTKKTGLGAGYFMYGEAHKSKTVHIDFPASGPLVVRMSAYGFEADNPHPMPTHVSVVAGGEELARLSFFASGKVTCVGLAKAGVGWATVTLPETMRKAAGGPVKFIVQKDELDIDEVQVQFSTVGSIVSGKKSEIVEDQKTDTEIKKKESEETETTYEVGHKEIMKGVYFDLDKYDLKAESYKEIDNLLQILTRHPTMKVEIAGHTDSLKDEAYNQTLSENRAKAVVDYLVGKGIDPSRLSPKGYGEDVPVTTNATPEGRAENRRVEFIVLEE